MKKTILSILAGLSILITGCSNEAVQVNSNSSISEDTIRVGVANTYIPWTFESDGKLQGYEIAIWDEIGERTGYKIEYITAEFSGLFGMLDAGQIDTIAHQISETPERAEKYDFTIAYANSDLSFVIPEDENPTSIEDMKGKRVGVGLGGNSEKSIRKMDEEYNLGLDIVTYDAGVDVAGEVVLGRIDCQFIGTVASLKKIEQGNLPLKIFDPDYVTEVNKYPFSKYIDNTEKISKINETLELMIEDGTLKEFSLEWLNTDVTENL